MSNYIDITEVYIDLNELGYLEGKYDCIPSLLEEGSNTEITKTVLKYRKAYKDENKLYTKALKAKKYNEATKHANNMKTISGKMKTELSHIADMDSIEPVIGTCLSVILSCFEFIIPSLLFASKFAIKRVPVVGGIIVAGINAGQKYAGVENETKQLVNTSKNTIQDIKDYQKDASLDLDKVNGYKVKMLNYCNQLDKNADYLIKMVKVNKILDS